MVDALAHWRADGAGAWAGGRAGLGHLMLRNTPESLDETQPWISPDGQLAITADARIDNRDELTEALDIPAATARSLPDCAFIVAAYRKWGVACPEFLTGDFAFALWDAREQHFFCARDYIGVKPFYYYDDRERFVFATEIKGIFAYPDAHVTRTLNERRLAELLVRTTGELDSSFAERIKILPAAHALVVSPARLQRRRYWQPDPRGEIRLRSDSDYVEAYREQLTRAVACRVRSSHPVASTLSEGLDSMAVTWLARRAAAAAGSEIIGLSWASHMHRERHNAGEGRYADGFLSAAPMAHRYVYVDLGKVFDPDDRWFEFHDGPIPDRRYQVMAETFGAAAESGARVLLFGLGGDEIATSHAPDYLLGLLFRGRLDRLAAEVRAQTGTTGQSTHAILRNEILRPLLRSRPGRLALKHTQTGLALAPHKTAANPAFVAAFADLGRKPQLNFAFGSGPQNPVRTNQIGLSFQGRFQRTMEGRYAPATTFGVECRFPLLDRRLVEFCLALPAEQHRSGGWARRLVRIAMTHDLPRELVWSPEKKAGELGGSLDGYASPRDAWLRQRLRGWQSHPGVTRYLDLDRLQQMLDACVTPSRRGAAGHFERGYLLAAYLAWRER